MKILFIAPLPPPVTGHSLVSKAFLDHLQIRHDVSVVDMGKTSFKQGISGINRIFQVLKIVARSWAGQRKAEVVYLTISESFAGNLKDLMIFIACLGDLSRVFLHLHGGSIRTQLWERHPLLHRVNRFFYRRLGGVIISGDSHREIFRDMIDEGRIHVVPNFAPEELFVDENIIKSTFSHLDPLKILFISSMQPEKGYDTLLQSYLDLDDRLRAKVQVDFAGRFDTQAKEDAFREKVRSIPGVHYHGIVDTATKNRLFENAHILCLPTRFREGQPITILEAYASGCVVITTGQPGIRDVFADGVNGIEVDADQRQTLTRAIASVAEAPQDLLRVAIANREVAERRYRKHLYQSRLSSAIGSGASPQGIATGSR